MSETTTTPAEALRSEIEALNKEIRGAEKSVEEVGRQYDRAIDHLDRLRRRRNEMRLKLAIP